MTDIGHEINTGLRRCAICKIDMKGRLVFVDDAVEKLLGATREDLFGRPIFEFLNESSQQIIDQLLNRRSHYETFFDATQLNIIGSDGNEAITTTIISLNYAAGNPVNFQLIITPTYQIASSPASVAGQDDAGPLTRFVQTVSAISSILEWKEFLTASAEYTGCVQAAVYLVRGDELQPRSAISNEKSAEFAFKEVSNPTTLHHRVARTGNPFSFVDDQAVRQAVEEDGIAPDEYVVCLVANDARKYVLRFLFAPDLPSDEANRLCDRTALVCRLAERLLATGTGQEPFDEEQNIKFAIGYLGQLGIGALLVDSGGKIQGYNSTFYEWLGDNNPIETIRDLAEVVDGVGGESVGGILIDYFNTMLDSDNPLDLNLNLRLPHGPVLDMIVVRFSFDPSDRSAMISFNPCGDAGNSGCSTNTLSGLWRPISGRLSKDAADFSETAERLSHEVHSRLASEQDSLLNSLTSRAAALQALGDDLVKLLPILEDNEKPQMIDLNLLMAKLLDDVRPPGRRLRLILKYARLPKLLIGGERLYALLYRLVSFLVEVKQRQKVNISVTAEFVDGACRLNLCNSKISLTDDQMKYCQGQDHSQSDSDDDEQVSSTACLHLAFAQGIAGNLGAKIAVESKPKQGLQLSVTIPNADPAKGGRSA